jgi:hypothetical protein
METHTCNEKKTFLLFLILDLTKKDGLTRFKEIDQPSILLVKAVESVEGELSGINYVVTTSKDTRDKLLRLIDNSRFCRGKAKAFAISRKDVPFQFCNFMKCSGINSFSFKRYVLEEIDSVRRELKFDMKPVFLEDTVQKSPDRRDDRIENGNRGSDDRPHRPPSIPTFSYEDPYAYFQAMSYPYYPAFPSPYFGQHGKKRAGGDEYYDVRYDEPEKNASSSDSKYMKRESSYSVPRSPHSHSHPHPNRSIRGDEQRRVQRERERFAHK